METFGKRGWKRINELVLEKKKPKASGDGARTARFYGQRMPAKKRGSLIPQGTVDSHRKSG